MKQHFITAINSLLIFLWTYTALSKLAAFNTSVTFLEKSPLLPVAEPLAVILPAAELLLAIMLIVPRSRRIALKMSLMLLIVFTGYIIYMISWYPQRPCNCGGIINTMSWTQHIFFNISLIALNMFAIIRHEVPTLREPPTITKSRSFGNRQQSRSPDPSGTTNHKLVDQPGLAENLQKE